MTYSTAKVPIYGFYEQTWIFEKDDLRQLSYPTNEVLQRVHNVRGKFTLQELLETFEGTFHRIEFFPLNLELSQVQPY